MTAQEKREEMVDLVETCYEGDGEFHLVAITCNPWQVVWEQTQRETRGLRFSLD